MSNQIFIDNFMQVDLSINLESFKSYIWGDASLWYQYDSTNPINPSSSTTDLKTNYRNYFGCTDAGITVKPILLTINLSIKLRNCYKTLIQSLTDWSNWTKIGKDAAYYGIFDYCKSSDPESVTVFSWNPVPSDYNYLFWGNTDNGNPQTDWDNSESGSIATGTPSAQRFKFDYCNHFVGTEYDLNNGGKFGNLYCAKPTAVPWTDVSTANWWLTGVDRTLSYSGDGTNVADACAVI